MGLRVKPQRLIFLLRGSGESLGLFSFRLVIARRNSVFSSLIALSSSLLPFDFRLGLGRPEALFQRLDDIDHLPARRHAWCDGYLSPFYLLISIAVTRARRSSV